MSSIDVDENLVPFLESSFGHRGLFAYKSGEDLKPQVWRALAKYREETLLNRIRYINSQRDDYKKKGVTLEESPLLKRSIRWEKEIVAKLKLEAPVETELSFLDESDRKRFGINDEELVSKTSGFKNMFDGFEEAKLEEMTSPSMPGIEKVVETMKGMFSEANA